MFKYGVSTSRAGLWMAKPRGLVIQLKRGRNEQLQGCSATWNFMAMETSNMIMKHEELKTTIYKKLETAGEVGHVT